MGVDLQNILTYAAIMEEDEGFTEVEKMISNEGLPAFTKSGNKPIKPTQIRWNAETLHLEFMEGNSENKIDLRLYLYHNLVDRFGLEISIVSANLFLPKRKVFSFANSENRENGEIKKLNKTKKTVKPGKPRKFINLRKPIKSRSPRNYETQENHEDETKPTESWNQRKQTKSRHPRKLRNLRKPRKQRKPTKSRKYTNPTKNKKV